MTTAKRHFEASHKLQLTRKIFLADVSEVELLEVVQVETESDHYIIKVSFSAAGIWSLRRRSQSKRDFVLGLKSGQITNGDSEITNIYNRIIINEASPKITKSNNNSCHPS